MTSSFPRHERARSSTSSSLARGGVRRGETATPAPARGRIGRTTSRACRTSRTAPAHGRARARRRPRRRRAASRSSAPGPGRRGDHLRHVDRSRGARPLLSSSSSAPRSAASRLTRRAGRRRPRPRSTANPAVDPGPAAHRPFHHHDCRAAARHHPIGAGNRQARAGTPQANSLTIRPCSTTSPVQAHVLARIRHVGAAPSTATVRGRSGESRLHGGGLRDRVDAHGEPADDHHPGAGEVTAQRPCHLPP